MKFKGEKVSARNLEICVIPRGDGDSVVFKCQAVLDMDDFEKLCPVPKPPQRMMAGGKKVIDIEDPIYKHKIEDRNDKRISYLILKSLEATEDLEWETVVMGDSDTWGNYETEFKQAGFSPVEIMRIINSCMTANCLNEDKLKEARDSFLASQQAQLEAQLSPNIEQ